MGAFELAALWRLSQPLRGGGGGVRLQEVAFAGLAAWALYAKASLCVGHCAVACLARDACSLRGEPSAAQLRVLL